MDPALETVPAFLERLRRLGVSLTLENGILNRTSSSSALTPEDLELLSSRRDELLAYLRARAAQNGQKLAFGCGHIGPSLGQETLWAWVTRSDKPVWNEILSLVRRYKHVSPVQVEAAIRSIVARHKTLRSSFFSEGGRLGLLINEIDSFVVQTIKISAGSNQYSRNRQVAERLASFQKEDIPVDDKWLVRARVLDLDDEVVIALFFNHLIFDRYSQSLILNELENSLPADAPSDKQETPNGLDFFDFAEWERSWFEAENGALLRNYWGDWQSRKPQFRSPSGTTLLWTVGDIVTYSWSLDAIQADKLRKAAAQLSTSLSQLFLAAYGVAVSGWSRSNHFPIRCVGNARTRRELTRIVGYMTCVDVVDFRLSSNQSTADVVASVAIEWQSSYRLRLPGCGYSFPDHPAFREMKAPEFTTTIPITFNFTNFPIQHDKWKPRLASVITKLSWPPKITRSRETNAKALVRPIHLRVIEKFDGFRVALSFNESQISFDDQKAILHHLLAEFASLGVRTAG
jgi:hypothetical protein